MSMPFGADRVELSRRRFLHGVAGVVGGAVVIPLLSSCGDDSGGAASTVATGGSGSTTTLSGGQGDTGSTIRKLLGLGDTGLGSDLSLSIGLSAPLTGPFSTYGVPAEKGVKLAAEHIRAAGGPQLTIVSKDMQAFDAGLGGTIAQDLGLAGISMGLTAFAADIGSMLPGIAQYQMFTLDPAAGTQPAMRGLPFYWGTRVDNPDSNSKAMISYLAQAHPDYKTMSIVATDSGPNTDVYLGHYAQYAAEHGITILAQERADFGQTDWSGTAQRMRSAGNPDVVMMLIAGLDRVGFTKQYLAGGAPKLLFTNDFSSGELASVGNEYEGMEFVADYFYADAPSNDWSKLFVEEYQKRHSEAPDTYSANYYESTFYLWQLIRAAIAAGKSPQKGADIEALAAQNLTYASLYGGSGSTVGQTTLSTETHGVVDRLMGAFRIRDRKVQQVGTIHIDGSRFTATS